MPDGVVLWFDPKANEAEIARRGRTFLAHGGDLESVARRAGARVHFDIRRAPGRSEQAVNVRLRAGTRVSKGQRRFGTLVGARHIDTKGPAPYAHLHPELASASGRPLEVARGWAASLSRGDVVGALSLYAPDAVIRLAEESVAGRAALQGWLEQSPVLGSGRDALVRGNGEAALVSWEAAERTDATMAVECRVAHGQIAEQWLWPSEVPEAVTPEGRMTPLEVAIIASGDVGQDAKARIEQKILQVVDKLEEPVLFARVKLGLEPAPARERPAFAQVALDLSGDLVRAQVVAHTLSEAVDLLADRLSGQLRHRAAHRKEDHRGNGVAAPGEWRHGDLPTPRPPHFERPMDERQVIRRRSFAGAELTADEAAFEMEQLDYDFYLFCDLASGVDSVLERLSTGVCRLIRVRPSTLDVTVAAEQLETSPVCAPVLSLSEALERLDSGGEAHVFFADKASGRGNVVYSRYDGHYGLVTLE